MKIVYATRKNNIITANIEIIAGYVFPFSYTLTGNQIIPDPSLGQIESLIVDYYNSLPKDKKDDWDRGALIENPPVVIIPPAPINKAVEITKRQFFQQAVKQNLISEADALAVFSGVIPESFNDIIDTFPEEERFAYKIAIIGANTYIITNSFVEAIAQREGWSNVQLQAFWDAASLL